MLPWRISIVGELGVRRLGLSSATSQRKQVAQLKLRAQWLGGQPRDSSGRLAPHAEPPER